MKNYSFFHLDCLRNAAVAEGARQALGRSNAVRNFQAPPSSAEGASFAALKKLWAVLAEIGSRITRSLTKRRRRRQGLRVTDLQQLGEKRFVAVVRVGRQKFLIGGSATSVSLLAELPPRRSRSAAARTLSKESA